MGRIGAVVLLSIFIAAGFSGCLGDNQKTDAGADEAARKLGAAKTVKSVFDGVYRFDGSYSYTLVPGPFAFSEATPLANGKQIELTSTVLGTSPNGKITMGLWLPAVPDGTKVPVIVDAGPYYGNGDVRETKPANRLGKFLIENFVPHGYAVVQLSVRGTGNHGGCMDLMGKDEQADLNTAITWLGTQSWSNGNVGMIGRSYDGSTPWEVAAQGNPHLKTIVPISGLSDAFGLFVYNGTSESRTPIMHSVVYWPFGFNGQGRSQENQANNVACPENFKGVAMGVEALVTGSRAPEATEYWHVRNFAKHAAAKYKGSIFMIHGFQDWNVEPHMGAPVADEFERRGALVKQLWGQWGHMYPDRPGEHVGSNAERPNTACASKNLRWDWAEIMLHWFDHELKGLTTVELGPSVQVLDSECRWRNEEHFPPRDANWTAFHLDGGNKLSRQAGATGSIILTPASAVSGCPLPGPACGPFNSARDGLRSTPGYKADFATPAFETGVQFSGLPRLHLTVTPHSEGGAIAGWMYSIGPDGVEKRIGWTSMNLLYAAGGDEPKPVVPNVPMVAKLQFEPMDAYIPAGHRLLVRLWETPYADHVPSVPPSPVTVHWGASTPSTLQLPVVERAPEAYFVPPQPDPNQKLNTNSGPGSLLG